MGVATLATVDGLMKEVYAFRLEDQLQEETVALKRIARTSAGIITTVGGKYVDFPIRVTRNTGIGYRLEMEELPPPGQQGYASVHVPLKYGYGSGRITGQVMELAETNYQAFASAFDQEMDGLKNDLLKDGNRVVYGDGKGLLASVTADGTNTVTVDTVQFLEVGMLIDILTRSNGAALATSRTITGIAEATRVVTYGPGGGGGGGDVTATTAEGIYRAGNYTSGTSREPTGLEGMVNDTSTLHGLTPASQPKWAATVVANGGVNRALSEGLMIQVCDTVRQKGGKVSLILTSLGVRRAYFNLLTQQRRYTDTKTFDGGFQGLAFNYGTEVPVVEDPDAPMNRMYFLDESKLKVFQSKEWNWLDEDGKILKWVSGGNVSGGFDAWDFRMKKYWEMGTIQRNAHAKLADITEG